MILQIASYVASLVNQAAQTPLVVQCPQVPPDPWWKWLLPTIVQTVVSLLSIGAGVAIAVWSFRRNIRTEHEQWLRDQKRNEWRELLRSTAEIQRVLRMQTMKVGERAREIAEKLKHAAHELSITGTSCIFLHAFFSDAEKGTRFYSFLKEADETSGLLEGLIEHYDSPDFEMTQEEKSRAAAQIMEKSDQIMNRYLDFCEWLRKEAAISLGAAAGSEQSKASS